MGVNLACVSLSPPGSAAFHGGGPCATRTRIPARDPKFAAMEGGATISYPRIHVTETGRFEALGIGGCLLLNGLSVLCGEHLQSAVLLEEADE
jgi:hypothetical protein